MKIEAAREAYQALSATFSENLRRACYAGIAAIWIFRVDTPDSSATLPAEFALALGLLVLRLGLDLAQYAVQGATWGIWARRREVAGRGNDELAPKWFNWAPIAFMVSKGAAGAAGIGVLLQSIAEIAL